MPKFNIYATIKSDGTLFFKEEELEFESIDKAKAYAKQFAKECYYLNPKRDVLDIMREDDVSEAIAHARFNLEMVRNIEHHVDETVEVDGKKEVIRR